MPLSRLLTAAACLLLCIAAIVQADPNGAQMRFLHAIPDVAAVDVYVNSVVIFKQIPYGQVSDYIALATCTRANCSIEVTPSGRSLPVLTADVTELATGAYYTVAGTVRQNYSAVLEVARSSQR